MQIYLLDNNKKIPSTRKPSQATGPNTQASLSMGFSRQEYWSGLPFHSPGGLLNPGIKPTSLASTPERREGLRACYWEGPSELPERRSSSSAPRRACPHLGAFSSIYLFFFSREPWLKGPLSDFKVKTPACPPGGVFVLCPSGSLNEPGCLGRAGFPISGLGAPEAPIEMSSGF